MAEVRFADLDPAVQEFLADLDEKKLGEIKEAMHFYSATRTVSRFMKWCLITIVAAFLTTAALGEALGKIWGWIVSIGGPK